jgi:ferric-dicitrate binding protein FerR (iron transport regulator)
VLGTAFEVQFNENQPESSVQVQQGKVRFEGTSEKNMLLTAGQKAVFNRQSAQMRAVQTDANALFWQNGMLVFDRTPLKAVFAQIEQLYHVKINVKNQEIGDCLLSATFPQPDAAALLRSIAQLYQMQFSEIGDNAYQLEGGICTE